MFLVKEQPTFLAQPAISLPACGRADVEDCSCHHRQCDTRGDEYRRRSHASSFLKSFKSFNRKRLIISAICFLLLIFILYLCDLNTTGGKGVGAATNFLRRAVDTTSEDGHQNAFVRQKLFLIVVFIGAFFLLWVFMAFSLWCCREAFDNPCCCPCYLCAYCGGIACLECILCC